VRAPLAGLAIVSALAAAVAGGCGTVGSVDEEAADLSRGKELFIQGAEGKQSCGSCHTLADAGTKGTIGPDLDEAFAYARSDSEEQGFDESTIRDVVRGQIAYPVEDPPTGEPGMPADLVTGDDADSVAAYVASVAGLPVQGGGGEAAGGGADADATDGRTIFTSTAGCGSCHTLAAAGTSGTVGPNLDESKPSLELAVDRVTNGRGAMPAFKDQLTEEQIQAVAKYVADNAGK
jgi:mono/diheme cytochrome c family protein